MNTKDIRFQSIHINFPKKAFAYSIWVRVDGQLLPAPIYTIKTSLEEIQASAIEKINKSEQNLQKSTQILRTILVLPLNFQKDVPLYKKYWQAPQQTENVSRELALLDAIQKFSVYQVLAVPDISKGETLFNAAMYFSHPSKRELDAYMANADVFVSPEAKNAALYSLEFPFGLDIDTGEVISKSKLGIDLN